MIDSVPRIAGEPHRDIKTANVHLSGSGEAEILDFGLAKLVSGLGGEVGTGETSS